MVGTGLSTELWTSVNGPIFKQYLSMTLQISASFEGTKLGRKITGKMNI